MIQNSISWAFIWRKIWKDTCTPMLMAALFTADETYQQPKCPLTDERIKMMWYTVTHTHTLEQYSAIKKNEIMLFTQHKWTKDYHEVRRRKTNIWHHLYVEFKMIQINLFIQQKQTHRHRKQIYGTKGHGDREGLN